MIDPDILRIILEVAHAVLELAITLMANSR